MESTAELDGEYRFTFDQKEVTLIALPNEEGRNVVAKIAIRKGIPESAEFRTSVTTPGPDGTAAEFRVEGIEEVEKELKEDLQFLESLLSLSMVTKIKWESPERSFIPENLEEKRTLAIYSLRVTEIYPNVYMRLKKQLLDQEVNRLRDLTIPLAFFREGVRSYQQFNYMASFQNFYFVIEGFYAEGDYRNQDQRFVQNGELVSYTRAAFPQILQLKDRLEPFFRFYKLDQTPESFLRLAVKIRHRLHHYFHGGEEEEYFGNPLTQDYYQPAALSLMLLCATILFGKVEGLRMQPKRREQSSPNDLSL